MTEDFDIDFDFNSPYEDIKYGSDALDDYRDSNDKYHIFMAGWDPDDPIYWIHLDIDGGYYYVSVSYFENRELEIGKVTDAKHEILLQLNNSPFDKEYFLIYDGEKISPKSREFFIEKIEHLVKLKNFI